MYVNGKYNVMLTYTHVSICVSINQISFRFSPFCFPVHFVYCAKYLVLDTVNLKHSSAFLYNNPSLASSLNGFTTLRILFKVIKDLIKG